MKSKARRQKLSWKRFFLASGLCLFSLVLNNNQIVSWVSLPQPNLRLSLLSQHSYCPDDMETLTNLMLRDLPSYANRVTQRARLRDTADATLRDRSLDVYGYFIVAGRAEFAPLTLGPGEYMPTIPNERDRVQQVFFTTLQRRYTSTNVVEIQDYHWLFLTKAESGWRLVMMYSATGLYPGGRPPTAPRESSNGVVGKAIELWLRDCRAGVVRSR